MERAAGPFERLVELPDEPDPDGAAASYADGLLTLEIPRRPAIAAPDDPDPPGPERGEEVNGMADETANADAVQIPDLLPVLPLKDVVLFPYVIVPLSVSREKSIAAVDAALAEQRILLLLAQKDPSVEEPGPADLYETGTAAAVMRMLKLPDGRIRLLVQGLSRVRVDGYVQESPSLRAKAVRIPEPEPAHPATEEVEALLRAVKEGLEKAVGPRARRSRPR